LTCETDVPAYPTLYIGCGASRKTPSNVKFSIETKKVCSGFASVSPIRTKEKDRNNERLPNTTYSIERSAFASTRLSACSRLRLANKRQDSREVLDNPVRVDLDPEVEQQKHDTAGPAYNVEEYRMSRWSSKSEEGEGEQCVGEEIVEEDNVDEVTEQQPYVEFEGSRLQVCGM
jgi:hypothetical protein